MGFPYFNSSETCPLDIDRTFATSASFSTYNDACACMDLILSANIPSGDYVDVCYISVQGAYGLASGGSLYALWIDSCGTGTNSGTFYMQRFSCQSGSAHPTAFIQFQSTAQVPYLFEIQGAFGPYVGTAGTYTTADGYLDILTPAGAMRIPFFAGTG